MTDVEQAIPEGSEIGSMQWAFNMTGVIVAAAGMQMALMTAPFKL